MTRALRTLLLVGATLVASPLLAQSISDPQSITDLMRFTDNGAWCWYQDERCIVDRGHPDGPMLLFSTVSFGPKGDPRRGDINLVWRNLKTGAQGEVELHDRLEPDDHDSAALYVRPDGRYLAVYTRHSSDKLVRWRISKRPHDPTEWSAEGTLKNKVRVCYSNVFQLDGASGKKRLYDFVRADGFDPNYFVSDDHGATWRYGGKLHTGPDGDKATGQRPYVKYAAHGTKTLHFVTTDGHPRNEDNSIYHGSLRAGRLHRSDGKALGPLSTSRVADIRSNAFTKVLATGTTFGGVAMRHAWTIDLAVDRDGNPYTVMIARADNQDSDHRFLYGRLRNGGWEVRDIAKAGGYFYKRENDYTGLAALHPHDPDTLVISTTVDPRNGMGLDHYELFLGRTEDSGASWTWVPVTWDSALDNTRPVIPIWTGDQTALLWLRGGMNSYTDWKAEVVGRVGRTSDLPSLAPRGQLPVKRPAVPRDR